MLLDQIDALTTQTGILTGPGAGTGPGAAVLPALARLDEIPGIWRLLTDPAARFCELGSAYHASHADTQRKARGHIRQLEALGYTVTLTQAA